MNQLFYFSAQLYVRTQNETGLIADEISEFLMSRILLARHSSLLAFRALISTCCVTPALEDGHKVTTVNSYLNNKTPSKLHSSGCSRKDRFKSFIPLVIYTHFY